MEWPSTFALFPTHKAIATKILNLLEQDERVLGVYLSGSFAYGQPDRYSDLDVFILVQAQDREQTKQDHANLRALVGDIVSEFPATHLGNPNQIITLYRDSYPVHVDYQYRVQAELAPRQKDTGVLILLDRTGALRDWRERCANAADSVTPDETALQYFEDRFWTWCIYTDSKMRRGELWEARDALEYLRTNVLLRLAYYDHGLPYEGNRRVERKFPQETIRLLETTLPIGHSQKAYADMLAALANAYVLLMDSVSRQLGVPIQQKDRPYFLTTLNR